MLLASARLARFALFLKNKVSQCVGHLATRIVKPNEVANNG